MTRTRTLLAVLLLAAAAGCELLPGDDAAEVSQVEFTEGRRLVYQHSFVTRDSLGAVIEATEGRYVVTVAATDETVEGMDDLVRLDESALDAEALSSTWYGREGSRLIEYAYRNAGTTPVLVPKRGDRDRSPWRMPRLVQRLADEVSDADSIIVRDDPRIVYQYPLVEGDRWVSFRDPFRSVREVVGVETVVVEAGRFRCAKIRTTVSRDGSLVWYDYVAADGLVLRTLTSTDERRAADNTPLGTFAREERLELVEAVTPR